MFDKLVHYIPQIRKAIVSGAVTLVLGWLALIGIDSDMAVGEALLLAVGAIVNAVLTWLVPNADK